MNMLSKSVPLQAITRFKFFVFLSVVLLLVLSTLTFDSVSATDDDDDDSSSSIESAKSADGFVDSIGVNTHLHHPNQYADLQLVKSKMVALGVRHFRDSAFLYNDWVPDNDNYGRYRQLAELGIKGTLIVDPRSSDHLLTLDPSKIEFMASMAGDSLKAFEGPNEYDISGDPNWVDVLREYQQALYESVKSNPSTADVPVIGPALVENDSFGRLGDMSAYMDYTNTHPFPGGRLPTNWLVSNIEFTNIIGGPRPVMATESGYNNALNISWYDQPVSEAAGGKYISRMVLEYFNHGIARTFLFQLLDGGDNPERNLTEINFGLVRGDGSDKPSFTAIQNLISLLNDPGPDFTPGTLEYTLNAPTPDVHHTLLQKRDGRFYLIVWQDVPSWDNGSQTEIDVPVQQVTITLGTQITNATTFLPYNSASAVESYDSPQELTVNVPDHPLVIELTPYIVE